MHPGSKKAALWIIPARSLARRRLGWIELLAAQNRSFDRGLQSDGETMETILHLSPLS
jgi:hypothetical protein